MLQLEEASIDSSKLIETSQIQQFDSQKSIDIVLQNYEFINQPRRQLSLNQEIISEPSESCSQLAKLTNPLEQIYKDMKLEMIENKHINCNMSETSGESPANFMQNEIFAFSKQSSTLYEAYGDPVVINTVLTKRGDQPQYIMIGTNQSVIIVIEIQYGRIDKVQAVFNSGDQQKRYGQVTSIDISNDQQMMICGFFKGDIQIFEIMKKWERISHISKCHGGPVRRVQFFNFQEGKIDLYEALSIDEEGLVYRIQYSVVRIFDKIMVNEKKDKIFECGKCVTLQSLEKQQSLKIIESTLLQLQSKESIPWWKATKSLFASKDQQKDENDKSDKGSIFSIESFIRGGIKKQDTPQSEVGSDKKVQQKLIFDVILINALELSNKLNYEDPRFVLLGLQYINRVEIIKVDLDSKQNCEIIYSLMRSAQNPEEEDWMSLNQTAQLSWGEGFFQASKKAAQCLMVRWGECFHLIKCINIDDQLELVEGAFLKMNINGANIIQSGFISNNILYYSTDDCKVGFIHTTQFQFQVQDNIVGLDLANRYRYLSNEEVQTYEPLMMVSNQESSQEEQEVSHLDYKNGMVLVLKDGRMYVNKLKKWNQFLDDLVIKDQWFLALFNGKLIYDGLLKVLANVPSSLIKRQLEMKQVLQKIAFTYLMFILKPIDIDQQLSNDELLKQVRLVIEFLIKTDNTVYVVSVVKDFFRDQSLIQLFFTALQPFVEDRMVTEIPASFQDEFIDHYIANQKITINNVTQDFSRTCKIINYFRHIIQTNVNKNIDDEIRLMYLELLCKYFAQSVLAELKIHQFPIDESLKICRQYKIIDAVSYLLQKTGSIQEAQDMLSQLFFTRMKECLKNAVKTKSIRQNDRLEIMSILQMIIDLCVSSQMTDDSYQSLWYQFLDKFFKENKLRTLTDKIIPLQIREILSTIVSEVLENMSKNVNLDVLLEKLQLNYGSLPLKTFLKTNESFKNKFKFESTTLKLTMNLAQKTYKDLIQSTKAGLDCGTFVHEFCQVCSFRLSRSIQVIIFNCGHSIHYECYLETMSNNSETFNSLKLASNLHACPVCLQDKSTYLTFLILQIQRKKSGRIETLRQQQSIIAQQQNNTIQPPPPHTQKYEDSDARLKQLRIRALMKHDFCVQSRISQVQNFVKYQGVLEFNMTNLFK